MLAAVGNALFIGGVPACIAITCTFSVGFVVGGGVGVVEGVVGVVGVVGGVVMVVMGGSVLGVVSGVVGVVTVVIVFCVVEVVGGVVEGVVGSAVVTPPSSSLNASSFVLIVLSGGRTIYGSSSTSRSLVFVSCFL